MRSVTLFSMLWLVGCGGSSLDEYPTAPVTGRVICDGAPVANVRVYFNPIRSDGSINAGRPGWATAGSDGSFVVTTYEAEDGAVVGRHRVMVGGPHPEKVPNFECDCETDSNAELMTVEVVEGDNVFEIVLPAAKSTKRGKPRVSEDDLDDILDDD